MKHLRAAKPGEYEGKEKKLRRKALDLLVAKRAMFCPKLLLDAGMSHLHQYCILSTCVSTLPKVPLNFDEMVQVFPSFGRIRNLELSL
jgi:hypothetical protein